MKALNVKLKRNDGSECLNVNNGSEGLNVNDGSKHLNVDNGGFERKTGEIWLL